MKEPKTTIMILMTETSTNPAPDASVNEFLLPPPDDIVDQDPEASNMSDSMNVSLETFSCCRDDIFGRYFGMILPYFGTKICYDNR